MIKTILKGRGICPGVAEGRALVCPNSIQGWAGIDDVTGVIKEKGHIHEGESIKDRILVIPGSKGSNGWSSHFYTTKITNSAPKGWIVAKMDSRSGVALAVMGTPAVTDLEEDVFESIQSGDWVRVDGDSGIIEIITHES